MPETTAHYNVPPTWHIRVPLEPQSIDAIVAELVKVSGGTPAGAPTAVPPDSIPTLEEPVQQVADSAGQATVKSVE